MGRVMPIVYRDWMKYHFEGKMCDNGLKIYGSQELVERNETFECDKYLQSYFIIGDDSGDTLYLMNQDRDAKTVYASDVGDMNAENLVAVSHDFSEWVEMMDTKEENDNDEKDYYAVFIKRIPDDIAEIIRIKNCLQPDLSTGRILRMLKKKGEVLLVPKIHICKYKNLMKGNEDLFEYIRLV